MTLAEIESDLKRILSAKHRSGADDRAALRNHADALLDLMKRHPKHINPLSGPAQLRAERALKLAVDGLQAKTTSQ